MMHHQFIRYFYTWLIWLVPLLVLYYIINQWFWYATQPNNIQTYPVINVDKDHLTDRFKRSQLFAQAQATVEPPARLAIRIDGIAHNFIKNSGFVILTIDNKTDFFVQGQMIKEGYFVEKIGTDYILISQAGTTTKYTFSPK